MFLTGPAVVRDALGEQVTPAQLGGTRVHERNGVCHFVASSDLDAAHLSRELLSYLAIGRAAPRPAPIGDPGACVPSEARRVYDVRDVVRCLVDDKALLEVAPGWARNIVTGFARIDGRSVGVIANQPSTWPGCSMPTARKRVPGSFTSATGSGSRCWCWSTPPATCRAPNRRPPV